MSRLIVCLGYKLHSDNSIDTVLENRLKDAVNLCIDNKDPTLILMGSMPYGDTREGKISEADAMKAYLEKHFNAELKDTKIVTEENTASTVEQICFLKNFIKTHGFNYPDLIIISSEFFTERVKLYAEYVFETTDGIIFIGAFVPAEIRKKFQEAEEFKLEEGKKWLKGCGKGDDAEILKKQREFQNKVILGEIKQPLIS